MGRKINNGKIIYTLCLLIAAFLGTAGAVAQTKGLKAEIGRIVSRANGHIGVAVVGIEAPDTVMVNGGERFPMQSVYKFPLAVAVLDRVDRGMLSLDQRIHVKKEDLLPHTWSPLREKYPNGGVDVALDEVVTATVATSDNNGCDILFRLLGGPKTVNDYLHRIGVAEIAIVSTEEEMHKDETAQYRNFSTPAAMATLLYRFYADTILSHRSKEYLTQIMAKTSTGGKRLKGLLPAGTEVAHKTGSSGTNKKGIAAATNDVGIVTLPNGHHVIIVVFVSDSSADEDVRDRTIADIAKAVWDASTVH